MITEIKRSKRRASKNGDRFSGSVFLQARSAGHSVSRNAYPATHARAQKTYEMTQKNCDQFLEISNDPSRCPSCGLLDDWIENPLQPFCSEVCRLVWRHGLAWRVQPCRIVVGSHPHLVIQEGPHFDLRAQALKGARERAMAAERKRRQRGLGSSQDVTPTPQYKPSIGDSFAVLEAKNDA